MVRSKNPGTTEEHAESSRGTRASKRQRQERRPPPREPTPEQSEEEEVEEEEGEEEQAEEPQVNPNRLGILFNNDYFRERFHTVCSRLIQPSRYVDDIALNCLGLTEDVEWLFENIGWTTFMNFRHPTYERLTYEFLSTFRMNAHLHRSEHSNGELIPPSTIRFQLFDEPYELSFNQLNIHLGTPVDGPRTLRELEGFEKTFWANIACSTEFDPRTAKSSQIFNPVLRYVHKVMASSVFGRTETPGSVRLADLFVLYCMLHRIHFNTAAFLANHFHTVARSTADIAVGGIITSIAYALGLHEKIHELEPVQTTLTCGHTIDLSVLTRMGMLKPGTDDHYPLVFSRFKDITLTLPNPTFTSVRNRNNWKYDMTQPFPLTGANPSGGATASTSHGPRPGDDGRSVPFSYAAGTAGSSGATMSGGYDFSTMQTAITDIQATQARMAQMQEQMSRTVDWMGQSIQQINQNQRLMFEHFNILGYAPPPPPPSPPSSP
jgi:hypothetical protein